MSKRPIHLCCTHEHSAGSTAPPSEGAESENEWVESYSSEEEQQGQHVQHQPWVYNNLHLPVQYWQCYVPYSLVLPRCDVYRSHQGGFRHSELIILHVKNPQIHTHTHSQSGLGVRESWNGHSREDCRRLLWVKWSHIFLPNTSDWTLKVY